MASREEVLASMKAPTPQDLDMKKVLQALAGAAAQDGPNTSWGYGMRLDDAQKEGALASQHQKEQNSQVQQAMGNALTQDAQMFDRARQAHAMAMQERQLALSEAAHAAEMQYKQARLPLELEAARLNIEKVKQEIAAERDLSKQFYNGVPLNLLRKMNSAQLGVMGLSSDPETRRYQRDLASHKASGLSDAAAEALARDKNLANTRLSIAKALETSKKNRKGLGNRMDFGQVDLGNGKKRPKTEQEFETEQRDILLRQMYPNLSEDDYQKLGPLLGGQLPTTGLPVQDASQQRREQITNKVMQKLEF